MVSGKKSGILGGHSENLQVCCFFFLHLILSSGMRLCNCPGLPGQGEETLQ